MTDTLWVYLGGRRVARLEHARGRLELRYDDAEQPPLSVRLPARLEPYEDEDCHAFFSNLLPEGSWRDALCRQLGIAPGDDFGLLQAIGMDCAGAVALHSDPSWTPAVGRYRAISEAELSTWVKNPASRPRAELTPGIRLSLAGAQDKLLVHIQEGAAFLCEDGAPSTVILKPDSYDPLRAVELSALNELFCMTLAHRVGVRAPRAFWFAAAFAVERYDRRREDTRWTRLHQEDFAQVLGLSPAQKYDVGWHQCFRILDDFATIPGTARLELVDRLMLDLVLGNCDAHGKNFSLLHEAPGRTTLAPAYDLVSTTLYPSVSRELAMPIGHARTLADLDAAAWRELAETIGVRIPFLRRRAADIAARATAALDGCLAQLETEHPALSKDVYPARRRADLGRSLSAIVRDNAARVTQSLAAKA
jgi:serine/threonine-protein kinase HipA